MIIDLPPHIEQVIIRQAKAQGISVSELIANKFDDKADNPMIARALSLPKTTCFDGVDAIELQREWRDEWEH